MATQMVIEGSGIPERDTSASAPESESAALIRIIDRVIERPDFDVAKLNALLDVRERYEKNEARKAYVAAMAKFKSDPPEINKNKRVKFSSTEYSYASLDHVCDKVIAALSLHGFSHRWEPVQTETDIEVTCIITHEMGHSERTTLRGPRDTSGSKNAIQSVGSTLSYLQRYTLLSAVGLAAGNDDDGKGAGQGSGGVMDNLNEHLEYIANSRNPDELKRLYDAAYDIAEGKSDTRAMKALIEAKNAKYRELVPAAAKNVGARRQ